MVPAFHADGTPITAWDLGIAEELGLEARWQREKEGKEYEKRLPV